MDLKELEDELTGTLEAIEAELKSHIEKYESSLHNFEATNPISRPTGLLHTWDVELQIHPNYKHIKSSDGTTIEIATPTDEGSAITWTKVLKPIPGSDLFRQIGRLEFDDSGITVLAVLPGNNISTVSMINKLKAEGIDVPTWPSEYTSLSKQSSRLVKAIAKREFNRVHRSLIKEVQEDIISRSPENSEIMSKAMDFCVRNN